LTPHSLGNPCTGQAVLRDCVVVGVAEALFRDGFCLPSGSNLSEDGLSQVVEGVRRLAR